MEALHSLGIDIAWNLERIRRLGQRLDGPSLKQVNMMVAGRIFKVIKTINSKAVLLLLTFNF